MDSVNSVADKIIRFLVTHAHCNECGGQYRSEDVYVLDQAGPRVWDLAAVCHQCYTLSVVRAVVRPHQEPLATPIAGPPDAPSVTPEHADATTITELTRAEARRFARLDPVGPDDVRDMSSFLVSFDGDFRGLFGMEPEET